MREATGNAYLLNFIIVFIAIFILFLVGSIAYSKAFKVKGAIIEVIEKEGGFTNKARDDIAEALGQFGYRVWQNGCSDIEGMENLSNQSLQYDYCIYKATDGNESSAVYRGDYYKVVTFITFDFPLISGSIRIPVAGETRNLRWGW